MVSSLEGTGKAIGDAKMDFLINPNVAYLLIFAAVLLALVTILHPQSNKPKIFLVLCLGAAGLELFSLQANPWTLLVTALSPLPFFIITRQERQNLSFLLLGLTIVMLTIVSIFIFVDHEGRPMVNMSLVGILALFSSFYLLFAVRQRQNPRGLRLSDNPDSLVGVVGQARTDIDDMGSVKINGELWLARSEKPILAGSLVRVVRCEGTVLFVKKVEKLTR